MLDDQGVEVDVVRSADALDAATLDASTTVVVTSTGNLGRSTTRRLLRHQGGAHLVVVAPGPELAAPARRRDFSVSTRPGRPVAAGCLAYDGLAVQGGRGRGLRTAAAASPAATARCSPSPEPA